MNNNYQHFYIAKNGTSVLYRFPQKEDVDELTRYANELSQEDTFVTLSGEVITKEEEELFLQQIVDEIAAKNRIHIFAFIGTELVGNAEVKRVLKSRKRSLHVGEIAISVAKEWRSKGIGREILKQLILESKKLGFRLLRLSLFANNLRARELYESLGFKIAGEIPGELLYKGEYIGHTYMYLSLV